MVIIFFNFISFATKSNEVAKSRETATRRFAKKRRFVTKSRFAKKSRGALYSLIVFAAIIGRRLTIEILDPSMRLPGSTYLIPRNLNISSSLSI